MTFSDFLRNINACHETIKWVGNRTAQQAWNDCPRADWMLWWLAKIGMQNRMLVTLKCKCVRTALEYMPKDEGRPRAAIELVEMLAFYSPGSITKRDLMAAAQAAWAAASDFSKAVSRASSWVEETLHDPGHAPQQPPHGS
jgi:hypothetical protein